MTYCADYRERLVNQTRDATEMATSGLPWRHQPVPAICWLTGFPTPGGSTRSCFAQQEAGESAIWLNSLPKSRIQAPMATASGLLFPGARLATRMGASDYRQRATCCRRLTGKRWAGTSSHRHQLPRGLPHQLSGKPENAFDKLGEDNAKVVALKDQALICAACSAASEASRRPPAAWSSMTKRITCCARPKPGQRVRQPRKPNRRADTVCRLSRLFCPWGCEPPRRSRSPGCRVAHKSGPISFGQRLPGSQANPCGSTSVLSFRAVSTGR